MRDAGCVKVHDVETPALLLHLDVVERNLAHMAARARQLGVALRPHAKTHKCVELARRQLEHGARGLTVSTLVEAEVFARAGFGDLTWAFPLIRATCPMRAASRQRQARPCVSSSTTRARRARSRSRDCTCGSKWTAGITGRAWTRDHPMP